MLARVHDPSATLRLAWSVIFWAFIMPMIGFSILSLLTFLPLLAVWMFSFRSFLGMLYGAGFIPSAVTSLFCHMLVRHISRLHLMIFTGLFSMLSATIWWTILMKDGSSSIVDFRGYFYQTLMISSFVPALIMARSVSRKHRKRVQM